ncbi:MAG: hypothetical protein NT069_24195, partial [Planctomycetota bacterium]|nr:hypothetical protein [Planctomycetota bacterium]
PAYQNWLKNLQATTPSGNQLTANNTTGGIQCCYDDTTGKLDSSSASAGTYDAASPQTSMTDHRTLDVNRDPGNYHIYNQSSGQNAVPPTPRPTPPPIPTPPPVPAPTPAANNSGNPVPQPVPTSTPKPY